MIHSAKIRALAVCSVLAVCFTLFSYRLIVLQVIRHDVCVDIVEKMRATQQPIYARRGLIQDFKYETLADNDPICSVIADGALINNPAAVAEVLAGPLQLKEAELRQKLATKHHYVVIKRQVTKANAKI